ncbi:MAG: hypothetical protein II086_00280, partial [Ruminococcus sp.]|nr:hypothetical protein [Ruminococcus sp.]
MKPFTLQEIAAACGGQYVGSEEMKSARVTSVERDSRQIKDGSLFLAIKGGRVDGHDFIEKCYEQGAVCALCEKAPANAEKPYILVPSTLDALDAAGIARIGAGSAQTSAKAASAPDVPAPSSVSSNPPAAKKYASAPDETAVIAQPSFLYCFVAYSATAA